MKKATSFLLTAVIVLCTVTMLNLEDISASSKKVYYSGSFIGNEKDVDKIGIITKVKFTKKKMKVNGSLRKGKNIESSGNVNTKYCKKKKRVFKLSKNVKFYEAGGTAGEVKVTKKKFVKFCKQLNKEPNGLGFWFIVKNGKVTKVVISS